jgi:phage regulator Rha-like protein
MSDTIPQRDLEVIEVEGENRMDSRLIARELNIEHEVFMRTCSKYQERLEHFGVIRFENGKPQKGSKGGRPEVFALLNENQSLFAITFSRNTEEVLDSKEAIITAFSEARKLLAQHSPSPFMNSLWMNRSRLFARHTKIPHHMFCVFQEINQTFFNFELRGYQRPEGVVPDISVGKRWCVYARETLDLDMSLVKSYLHHYPDRRGEKEANTYPLAWLPAFRLWFYETYLPENLPDYLKYLKASNEEIQHVLEGLGYSPQIED